LRACGAGATLADARAPRLELHPTDITAVAAEVVRREAPSYAERQIRVEERYCDCFPLVLANPMNSPKCS
jgi:hypothetical protein